MKTWKGLLALMLGLLLCCCIAAGAMAAEEVEIEEGVFQGYDGYGPLLRGVYHTKYPELSDLKIEENGKTLKAGDTVHISVKATAYDTDVDYVNVEIGRNRSEYKNLRMSLNAQTGRYEGTYTFTAQDRPGEYYIVYANIHDKYSFYTNYSSSSKRVMKRLFPGSVVLKNDSYTKIFKNITLTENGKELTPGSTLHLSFDLPKNLNIERAYISFYGKGDYDLYLHYYQQNNRWNTSDGDWNYDATTGIVTCTYTLKATDTNGNYYLGYIEVYDEDDIQYRINNLGNSAYTFTLTGATAGGSAANYTKVEEITSDSNGKTLVDGNKVTVKFKVATNGELQYARARLEFFDAYEVNYGTGVNTYINYTKEIDATPVAGQAGYYQAEYVLQDTDLYGVYTVEVATNTRYGNDNTDYKTTESDIMFRFDQKATTTLNRLAPATNLNWTADGYARFTLPENHQGTMSIRLHREDQGTNNWSTGWSTSGLSKDNVEYFRDTGDDILRCMGNPESGKYYFTVTMHGDGINYFDSVTAKSDLFTYTVPNKKLGMVSSIRWDKENKEVLITAPAQETNDYWAEGQWYFGETADDTPQSCGWTSGGWRDEDNGVFHIDVPDMMLQEYGSGTYYMKARLESSNVLAYNHGDWGELSDGFYIGADEADNSTIDKLEDVETENKTANEIREQVQKIDTKDLKVAMLSDEDAAEKIHELEIQANAETQVVSTNDSPVNAANVSAVGAGLNNVTGTPKLVIDKAKQDDVMPAQYDNTVAVRFSMELQNVENPDNLKVPVLIDIPIPDNINHAYLVILHYHLTTNQPERITPYVYQAGNKWYAQFVLTRFSDFIMTEDLEAKKNASKTPTELIKEFVTRCYRIILSREPEQEGLDYWTQKLASGEMTAAEIINSFVYSNEFQSKHLSYEDSVEVLYTVMLDRASDAGGKAYWVSVLQAGNPFGAIINGFCNSDEFTGICAGYGIKPGSVDTNGQAQAPAPAPAADMNKIRAFVTRNYRVILGREPDADGLNYWAQRLASGEATAAEIINGFVESIEFRGKNLSYGDQVEVLYQVMLDRGSDADGKAYWMSMLNGGNPLAAVINGFCNSIEFKGICTEYGIMPGSVAVGELKPPKAVPVVDMDKLRAYVTRCYRIILGREPDQEGLNYWTGKMATGELQAAAIIDEFVNSIEFMDKQLSDREAVEVLYQAMLGRGSDEAGMGYWLEKLNAGEPFAVIINGFCNSVEFKGICAEYGITPGSVAVASVRTHAEPEEQEIPEAEATEPEQEAEPAPADERTEQARAFVTHCYQSALLRDPSAEETDYYANQILSGQMTAKDVARAFAFSQEFQGKWTDSTAFVRVLYRLCLDREADADGLVYWTDKLANGETAAAVFNALTENKEFVQICATYGVPAGVDANAIRAQEEAAAAAETETNEAPAAPASEFTNEEKIRAFVSRFYRDAMGREADEEGLNYYTSRILNGEATPKDVAGEIILSEEFRGRMPGNKDLVRILYRVYLGREADEEGLANWAGQMDSGVALETILNGFAGSEEFAAVVNGLK